MPDYFVPLDTTYQSDYYRKLINQGILNFYVLNYVDDNRKKLTNKYPDFDSFNKQFTVTGDILEKLFIYADNEGLPLNKEDLSISEDHIKMVLKGYIARDLWSTSEFYQVVNTQDKNVLKAIEVLEKGDMYQAVLQIQN